MLSKNNFALIGVALLAIFSFTAHAQTKLLRFPDIQGDRVIFTYAGDLWTAPSRGGTATPLSLRYSRGRTTRVTGPRRPPNRMMCC